MTGAKTDSKGAYGVVALNLFDANGNPAQDQLAIVPAPTVVPEPMTTAIETIGAFIGLVGLRRIHCRKT
ncbi:MAG: hypothetical protein ACLP2Y_03090 [Limisphaerales bacterium]